MKKARIVITIVLIGIILFVNVPIVYALNLADLARQESGPRPDPETPEDTPINQEPTSDGIERITVIHNTSIEGNVYEDLGEIMYGNVNKEPQKGSSPISDITVRLMSGNTVVDKMKTDKNGYYSFSPAEGTYSLEFVYGDITDSNLNDNNCIKNILRYNGHDYITTSTKGNSTNGDKYIDITKQEVIKGGQGCAQVNIAIDCSSIMRSQTVQINQENKTRLQAVCDAAKELVSNLLKSGDNISIGLIFFSGTAYRAVSIGKNEELLKQALDDIVTNNWCTHNTNIVEALDKAKNSFYIDENDKDYANHSNRYIAILSDGIPTSDGNTEVYYDDSDSEVYSKLSKISNSTKKKIEELKADGIKVMSLLLKTGNSEEEQFAEEIFKNSTMLKSTQDGQEMIKSITKDLKEYITNTTESSEFIKGSDVIVGLEDANRRKEVDSKYETFYYKNTIPFNLINNYTGSNTDKALAKELSGNTYMVVKCGTYTISNVPNTEYEYDENGNVKKITYHKGEPAKQYVTLAQRPALSLVTKVTATGLKIKLADGQILPIETKQVGEEQPMIKYMDEEIMHGATVQIEYTISVKNDSNVQCNYLEIINHNPNSYFYESDTQLITEEGTNAKYNWSKRSLEELCDYGYVSEYTLSTYLYSETIVSKWDNAGQGANGFYISPGGEKIIKLVVSKVVGDLDNAAPDFDNVCEVLVYKSNANRRMAYVVPKQLGMHNGKAIQGKSLIGVYPGNSEEQDCSQATNRVIIIPPTGENINKVIIINYTIILIIVLITIILLIIIKKKLKGRNIIN